MTPPRRVLVVEDNRLVGDLVTDVLEDAGYHCARAHDGEEAVRMLTAGPPDAVVLDLNLPRLHGLEVLRHVRQHSPDVVVVVLTGHGSEQTALQALRQGANDYLTKPVCVETLLETLQIHLERADLHRCACTARCFPSEVEEHTLARVFFEAPTALVSVDPEDRIRVVNRAAVRLLARAPEDLLDRPVADLVCKEVRSGWLDAVRRDAATACGYEGEVHVDGGGGRFPAGVVAVEQPDPGWLIVGFRDLARQKALEKHYLESKKLAGLGRVVEGVAHEVRNPLLAIGGFARKLGRALDGDETAGRYLDVILSEVERLERMVRDIEAYVAFSRENRPHFEPVDLGRVIEGCLAAVAGRARRQGVQVLPDLPPALPRVYADRALLGELFGGIVENALDAMPSGGQLRIALGTGDNWVQVRVADTGVGIPEDDLEEIFDPFFTSKTSGAGLGLAKAYLIVEAHSGTIEFDSRVGKGTTCTVALPVDRREIPRGER